MRFSLCILLVITLFPYPSLAQSKLQELITKNKITGIQLSWTDHKNTISQQAGFANLEENIKVNSNTILQAASLSKVVLAYICLELVDQKKIDLDAPLAEYYTYKRLNNDSSAKKITARMVLQHRSGLPNWAENPMKRTWAISPLTTSFEPGTKWKYSGEGYVYLQLAIQQILQKNLQQIADSLVFKPLKMRNSSFIYKEDQADCLALGYSAKNAEIEHTSFFLPNAAFSLTTTTTDYSLFLNALLAKHLKKLLNQQVSVIDVNEQKKSDKFIFWSLGIGVQKNELGTAFWHWGDNGNFKSFFIVYPERNQLLVSFMNHKNGLKLMRPLVNSFFGKATWNAINWLGY